MKIYRVNEAKNLLSNSFPLIISEEDRDFINNLETFKARIDSVETFSYITKSILSKFYYINILSGQKMEDKVEEFLLLKKLSDFMENEGINTQEVLSSIKEITQFLGKNQDV